jgi:hypothetical protein
LGHQVLNLFDNFRGKLHPVGPKDGLALVIVMAALFGSRRVVVVFLVGLVSDVRVMAITKWSIPVEVISASLGMSQAFATSPPSR